VSEAQAYEPDRARVLLEHIAGPYAIEERIRVHELAARDVGIAQSLIVTCRLHRVDPYDYLVDVLQRVGTHPADGVDELTPRRWKTPFAAKPLRSPLHTRTP
jgi:hypothetical protein